MKKFALACLLLSMLSASAQVAFQVRHLPFSDSDSVTQLVEHPNGNEVVRIFSNKPSGQPGYAERGVLRERGDRIMLPSGERFFCWDGSKLVTESLNQSRDRAGIKALRLKRYQVNKDRLTVLDERVDSLGRNAAPLWRRWNGTFLIHPECQNMDQYEGNTLLALRREDGINLQAFRNTSQVPVLSQILPIAAPGKQAGNPWVKPLIASPDVWLLTSYFFDEKGNPQNWFTALDTLGNIRWQEAGWGELVDHFHPLGMLLATRQDKLLGLQLEATDSRTGKVMWTLPLFDLYNSDSLFSYSSLSLEEVHALDIAPVLGGSYTAVLMVHGSAGDSPLLYVLDDQGKVVYRYAVDGPARLARLQERDTGFALVTEKGSWLFRPR